MSITPRIEELRKKFEENPRRYFAPLANELRKAGELAQAIALCHEHLPKQPGHMSGHIVFGQALYEHGDLEQGRAVFEQALALDPENLIALRHLGDIARRLGDAPAARRWYERVLEADPRNDDIAAQLATLATGATPMRTVAVPPSEFAAVEEWSADVPSPQPAPLSAHAEAEPVAEPMAEPEVEPMAEPVATLSPMRAFAETVEPEDGPVLLDLESIEASAPHDASAEMPAFADPFFGAPDESFGVEGGASTESDAELSFEEGLAAAEWPDTTEFAHRITQPRGLTPVTVAVTPDAVDAFGREPNDAIVPALPEPEPDLVEAAAVVLTPTVEQAVAPVERELFWIAPPGAPQEDDDEQEPAHDESIGGFAPSDDDEPVATFDDAESEPLGVAEADTDDAELPWLAAPVTPDAEVGAIVDAFAEDARAKGESDDVSVISMPEPTQPEPVQAAAESSFAGVMSDADFDEAPSDEAVPVTSSTGAFVTETMGELFVAQGLTDRAVGVYEELVRRRPDDPAPAARLAELRAQLADSRSTPSAGALTARARFAALAARRVDRRTPGHTASAVSTSTGRSTVVTPPAADSLATLFHVAPAPHDEEAALGFATAFGRPARPSASDSFFDSDAMAVALAVAPGGGSARETTPFGAATATPAAPAAPSATASSEDSYAFDRFFPDPAASQASVRTTPSAPATGTRSTATPPAGDSKAADDLAQFSAWLKGLGSP